MTKPRALKKGDTIGLIAPSGSLRDKSQAARAAAALESLGFAVKAGRSCTALYGYLAGSDELRAADVNAFFADPEVAGIVCLKGGYGTPRILDALDYGLISRNPKVFVGYSDITGLHLAFNRLAKLVTFHGPMGISDVILDGEEFSVGSWIEALTSTAPLGILNPPPGAVPVRKLVGGKASGTIIGGNLSLVAATMGTPYEIDTKDRIIFLEDIGERPYRVDRMLTQLRLAGKFEDCAGIVLGDWNDCGPEEGKPSLELAEVFRDVVASSGKPAICDFRAGHCAPQHTIPFGVEAVLDADACTLTIVEGAALP